jgi:hypothetical protein
MKFLWINNVGTVVGGTLACTLSMVQSFPDVEHTVFSFSRFGDTEYEVFPKNVKLVSGSNLREFISNTAYDVVIYQNTSYEQMVSTYPNKPLRVYIAHSNHRGIKQCTGRVDVSLCVSQYLSELCGMNKDQVILQPVTIPPVIEDKEFNDWAEGFDCVIGRLCSPNPSKWKYEDVYELTKYLNENLDCLTGFHFVGCPDYLKEELKKYDNCFFSGTSFRARGYLHHWDYLVYKSSLPESYGRVVKEAQRCSCVPVVSDLGGFKEQINETVTGYSCEDNDDFLATIEWDIESSGIDRRVMKQWGDLSGSCSQFRKTFLGVLRDHCKR